MWVLHLEGKYGVLVAYKKSGMYRKSTKSKYSEAANLEKEVQLMHIQHVFILGVVPMYAGNQLDIRVL
jgi:hypothetical protein